MSRIYTLPVRIYQLILSPALHALGGPFMGCRFVPTCSHYSMEALQIHGLRKGLWLTLLRISRCHPFAQAGFDPVPRGIPMPTCKPNPLQGR